VVGVSGGDASAGGDEGVVGAVTGGAPSDGGAGPSSAAGDSSGGDGAAGSPPGCSIATTDKLIFRFQCALHRQHRWPRGSRFEVPSARGYSRPVRHVQGLAQ
jgi:hypothetical protein